MPKNRNDAADPFLLDLSESVCVFRPDLSIVSVNQRLAMIWKQPADKLVGQNLSSLLDNKSQSILKDLLSRISRENSFIQHEYRVLHTSGEISWRRWRLRGKFDGNELRYIQAAACDITNEMNWKRVVEEQRHTLKQQLQAQTSQLIEVNDRLLMEIKERQEIERDYRDLFDNANDIIYIRDLQGKVISVNRAGLRYWNRTIDEVQKMNIKDVLPSEYLSVVEEKTALLLSGQTVKPYEVEIIKDGAAAPVEISPRLIYKRGRPYAVQVIVRDITERKKKERAILESRQKLSDIIGFLPDPTFAIDKLGRVIAWNLAMEEMTGIKAKDMLGRGDYAYAVPFYGYPRPMLIDQIMSPSPLDFEYPIHESQNGHLSAENYCPSIGGKGAHMYGTASPIYDKLGNKVGAIESLRDVSYQKKIQLDLAQSQANFKHLADTAPSIIYVLSGSRILYVNHTLESASEYPDHKLKEMEVWDFIHPDDRDWVRELSLARQRGEDVPSRYQARLLKEDGTAMWGDISTANIVFNNQPAILGVIIDITDRKEAEEKIIYLSYHDRLTGLHNRSYAEEKLRELDNIDNLPLSMIIGDVNGLKLVNDAFGHQEGDKLLRTAADVLSSCCEDHDILARWGGDEFVILLPRSSEERALQICDAITRACNELEGFPVQMSISLGTATKRSPEVSMEQVSKEAEDRMYRNKLLESKSNRSSFLYSLEKTLWVRSHETQEHTDRLRQLVGIVAGALHLQPEEVNSLTLLAALHDIGKIAIPNSILDKPSALDPEEWSIMTKHPEIGYRIALSCPELAPIADAILTHHERWDGSGYPLGLKEREIPLVARILALADAYDVMLSGRSYREAMSKEEALEEIARCAGSQFDPHLARLFIGLLKGEEVHPRMMDIF